MTQTATVDPVQHVLQLATGYVVSTALQLAVEVGVADRLASGPLSVRELAEATSTNEDALYRLLRLLASVGVFDEIAPRRFSLTPAADSLRADAPHSIRPLVLFIADFFKAVPAGGDAYVMKHIIHDWDDERAV